MRRAGAEVLPAIISRWVAYAFGISMTYRYAEAVGKRYYARAFRVNALFRADAEAAPPVAGYAASSVTRLYALSRNVFAASVYFYFSFSFSI